jgi:hypothetical protein
VPELLADLAGLDAWLGRMTQRESFRRTARSG